LLQIGAYGPWMMAPELVTEIEAITSATVVNEWAKKKQI
jgi:hypothetical protein